MLATIFVLFNYSLHNLNPQELDTRIDPNKFDLNMFFLKGQC